MRACVCVCVAKPVAVELGCHVTALIMSATSKKLVEPIIIHVDIISV